MTPAQAPAVRTFFTIEECRALLGAEAVGKTDAEIAQLRHEAYEFAGIITSQYRERQLRAAFAAEYPLAVYPERTNTTRERRR